MQRWHASLGLPVHHFGGGNGGVFSFSDELDAWLAGFAEEGSEGAEPDGLLALRMQRSSELATRADELWELRTEDNLAAISTLYRKAVDRNPLNGAAFVGLANSITLSALTGVASAAAAYPRAADALERVSRLSPETAEARCAAAWLQLVYERKWNRAREGFDFALELQPDSSHALAGRALLSIAHGNVRAASRYMQHAWEGNKFASLLSSLVAWNQYLGGDCESAIETVAQSRSCGEIGSLGAAVESLALIQSGPVRDQLPGIEAMAAAHPRNPLIHGALGFALAACDQTTAAREVLQGLSRARGTSHYAIAVVLIGLGERHQAMPHFEACYAEGSLWSLGFRCDPLLEALRGDSRLGTRLRRLGPGG